MVVRLAVLLTAVSFAARASAAPDDLVSRPLVLGDGEIQVQLVAELNMDRAGLGRPSSLSPDAWWGVSPDWTLGVIHSSASVDQIGSGATLCVVENTASMCDRLYRGSGIDVRYSALAGPFAVAPRVRALIRDIDPFKPALTAGALARWTTGRFAITIDPYLRIPLANHRLGNRASLVLPIWFAVQPTTGWVIVLQTGYQGDLVVFRDGGHGPLALSVTARATPEIDLGFAAGWATLLGPQHDARHGTLMITADWRR